MTGVYEAFAGLADPLGRLDARFLAAALVFQGANLVFRAAAWRNVLAAAYPARRLSLVTVGAAYAAGAALNGFVPARGGDAAKVALVRLQVPGTSVVAIAGAGSVLLLFDAVAGAALLGAVGWSGALRAPPGAPDALAAVAHHGWLALGAASAAAVVAWAACRLLASRAARVWTELRRGTAVLGSPRRYVRTVVSMQLAAWACRIAVAFSLLAAFGLPASLTTAALVVVLGSLSTVAPAPGGAGAQQVLVVYGLQGAVSAAAALSFSIGMQVGITAVNTAIGLAALMFVFRTLRPVAAVRSGLRATRD